MRYLPPVGLTVTAVGGLCLIAFVALGAARASPVVGPGFRKVGSFVSVGQPALETSRLGISSRGSLLPGGQLVSGAAHLIRNGHGWLVVSDSDSNVEVRGEDSAQATLELGKFGVTSDQQDGVISIAGVVRIEITRSDTGWQFPWIHTERMRLSGILPLEPGQATVIDNRLFCVSAAREVTFLDSARDRVNDCSATLPDKPIVLQRGETPGLAGRTITWRQEQAIYVHFSVPHRPDRSRVLFQGEHLSLDEVSSTVTLDTDAQRGIGKVVGRILGLASSAPKARLFSNSTSVLTVKDARGTAIATLTPPAVVDGSSVRVGENALVVNFVPIDGRTVVAFEKRPRWWRKSTLARFPTYSTSAWALYYPDRVISFPQCGTQGATVPTASSIVIPPGTSTEASAVRGLAGMEFACASSSTSVRISLTNRLAESDAPYLRIPKQRLSAATEHIALDLPTGALVYTRGSVYTVIPVNTSLRVSISRLLVASVLIVGLPLFGIGFGISRQLLRVEAPSASLGTRIIGYAPSIVTMSVVVLSICGVAYQLKLAADPDLIGTADYLNTFLLSVSIAFIGSSALILLGWFGLTPTGVYMCALYSFVAVALYGFITRYVDPFVIGRNRDYFPSWSGASPDPQYTWMFAIAAALAVATKWFHRPILSRLRRVFSVGLTPTVVYMCAVYSFSAVALYGFITRYYFPSWSPDSQYTWMFATAAVATKWFHRPILSRLRRVFSVFESIASTAGRLPHEPAGASTASTGSGLWHAGELSSRRVLPRWIAGWRASFGESYDKSVFLREAALIDALNLEADGWIQGSRIILKRLWLATMALTSLTVILVSRGWGAFGIVAALILGGLKESAMAAIVAGAALLFGRLAPSARRLAQRRRVGPTMTRGAGVWLMATALTATMATIVVGTYTVSDYMYAPGLRLALTLLVAVLLLCSQVLPRAYSAGLLLRLSIPFFAFLVFAAGRFGDFGSLMVWMPTLSTIVVVALVTNTMALGGGASSVRTVIFNLVTAAALFTLPALLLGWTPDVLHAAPQAVGGLASDDTLRRLERRYELVSIPSYFDEGEWLGDLRALAASTARTDTKYIPNLNSDVAFIGLRHLLPGTAWVATAALGAILLLMAVGAVECLRRAQESTDQFSQARLLCAGFLAVATELILIFQIMVHIAPAAFDWLPLTGVAYPWISHGFNAHLAFTLLVVGTCMYVVRQILEER